MVNLKFVAPEDDEFLLSVYAASRAYELAMVPWTDEQKAAFVRQQFIAQQQHYQTYYKGAEFQVILRDNTPVGRLYVYRGEEEIRIVDIALLPEYRNQGIGKPLIQGLLNEARETGKHVRIHVEVFNPISVDLFERLGFTKIDNDGINFLMEWTPMQ
jgi:ribosomal protein S18 acetylase RimI-like enzyme